MADLELDPTYASQLCVQAQGRLHDRVADLDEHAVRAGCLLPEWSVGHLLTHLARNADAHARRIEGALSGRDLPKYVGGAAQRRSEIEAGSRRPAPHIIDDLHVSQTRLEAVFVAAGQAGWPNAQFRGGGGYGVGGCPAHRLREVEMHHVDLGLGYTSADWPAEYVDWDLPVLLATVPERMSSLEDRQLLMAWLAGRAPMERAPCLAAWG